MILASQGSWSGLMTLHFNPTTLKLKKNEVILSKPQSTLNHITSQPIWLSKACLHCCNPITAISPPPLFEHLTFKAQYKSTWHFSTRWRNSFVPYTVFWAKRNYICYANTSNLSGNFNTFLCKNCTLWIPLNVQYWHNSISSVLQTSLYFCF